MPYLVTATQSLEVVWASAPSAEGAWWADFAAMTAAGTAVAPHTVRGLTAGTTPVALMPAPSSGLVNCLVNLAVRNAGAVAEVLHVQMRDGSSVFPVMEPTLQPGDSFCFNSRDGWFTINDQGERKVTGGGGGGGPLSDVNVIAWGGTVIHLGQQLAAASVPVVLPSDMAALPVSLSGSVTVGNFPGTQAVEGIVSVDNFPATQPISAASLPLPSGAATAAKQAAFGTAGTASADVLSVQGRASMTPLIVDGSGVTQPISAASLPLPSGAATAAKQAAFGTAGTASADVLSVQGRASMTPLIVDGSGVTQPVSAAALPLPSGAATSANQPGFGTAGSPSVNVVSVQGVAGGTALPLGPANGSLTDRSGTIAANNTSQQVMASNSSRKYLLFQNVSNTVMWINFGVAAVANQPSLQIPAGGSFAMEGFFVSTQAVNVICANSGKAYAAKEA